MAAARYHLLSGIQIPRGLRWDDEFGDEWSPVARVAEYSISGALLVDADRAILGALPGRYHVYTRDVRLEYDHVDDDAFAAGRAAVLRHLLALDPLYQTPTGAQLWARQAHANMTAELAALSA